VSTDLPAAPEGEAFDAHYYAHNCGRPYERDDWWLAFFGRVADRIVAEIVPASVLDVGCAMGFLVEALRERGVEAYGLDVSTYAISQASPDVSPYLWVGRATEPAPAGSPARFDLVTCIEVLEHLEPGEADATVEALCDLAGDVIFSSTPVDFRETTHRNVQPPEYWAGLFARHGFARDLDFDGSFLTPWTRRFRRGHASLPEVVRAYERRLWVLEQASAGQRESAEALRAQLAARATDEGAFTERLADLEAEADVLRQRADLAGARADAWEARWRTLEASPAGAVVRTLQGLRAAVAPPGSRRDRVVRAVSRNAGPG
jgi:SAM-dependent methyltransferase